MHVEIIKNLSEIKKDIWDGLSASNSIFYNYGWFKCFENDISNEHVYFVVKTGEQVVGILPGFIVRDPAVYVYHNPREIIFSEEFLGHAISYLNREKRVFLKKEFYKVIKHVRFLLNKAFFPALVFVSPFGYLGDILVNMMDCDYEEVSKCLLKEVDNLARLQNLKCITFPWVPTTNSRLINFLSNNGFISSYGKPVFEMKINWQSFDDYLNIYLKSNRRKFVKKEIKRFEMEGISIIECSNEEALGKIDVFAKLVHLQLQKFGHKDTYESIVKRLRNLYFQLPEYTKTFYAEKGGKVVGYVLSFLKNGVHYPKFIGFDDSLTFGSYLYFNLIYYNLIRDSSSTGDIRKIYYSYASEDAKLKRGCQSYNAFCYYKFTNKRIHKFLTSFLVPYSSARMKYFKSEFSSYVINKENSFLT